MRVDAAGVVVIAATVTFAAAGCGGTGDDRAGGKGSDEGRHADLGESATAAGRRPPSSTKSSAHRKIATRAPRRARRYAADTSAWPAARAWDDVGVTSFDALHAPLVVDSYELEGEVLAAGVADEPSKASRRSGSSRSACCPARCARCSASSDCSCGLRISTGCASGSTARRSEAHRPRFGAMPVTVPGGVDLVGQVDGLEQHVASIDGNTYDDAAKYLTANVNLWPRWVVVFRTPSASSASRVTAGRAPRGRPDGEADDARRRRRRPGGVDGGALRARADARVVAERSQRATRGRRSGDGASPRRGDARARADRGATTGRRRSRLDRAVSRADDAEGEPGPRRHLRHGDDGRGRDARRSRQAIRSTAICRSAAARSAGRCLQGLQAERHESYVHAGTYTIYRDRSCSSTRPTGLPAWSFDGKT